MTIQILRYFLWIILFLIIFLIYNSWQNEKKILDNLKSIENKYSLNTNLEKKSSIYFNKNLNEINIETNLISSKIDLNSGNISYVSLKNYNLSLDKESKKVVLLDFNNEEFNSIIAGFLLKESNLNESNITFKVSNFNIDEKDDNIILSFNYHLNNAVKLTKVYTFKSYTYDINLDFFINNMSDKNLSLSFYGIINYKNLNMGKGFFSSSNSNYSEIAYYTNKKPYNKLALDSSSNKTINCIEKGGWIAYLDRYFLSSWIPDFSHNYIYSFEKTNNNSYTLNCFSKNDLIVLPGDCLKFESKLYFGPKLKNNLIRLHDGLDLSIDYGIFWPIATPMFLLLSKIYDLLNNWGLSIIFITVMIKLLFFHLSALSYNSMAKIKTLQPRLDLLKERYKDDKKLFGQAVLDLYKKESVNPLSGCFPIFIQIPFFISLYYVLLESVELRHAEFYFWINDLSSKDPYYILPIIMSFTILIQQKVSPSIQDPTQKMIMNFLPFVFLILFLQFPSGLVLYWIINNILSIFQQILINNKY